MYINASSPMPRYPDPEYWQLLDNKDAAKCLQEQLDTLDGLASSNS